MNSFPVISHCRTLTSVCKAATNILAPANYVKLDSTRFHSIPLRPALDCFLRTRMDVVVAFIAAQPLDSMYISIVTLAEIRFGI